MILSILTHVPPWVYVLLLVLIALGVMQSFPRVVSLRRNIVLPLTMVGLSLYGVVAPFGGQPLALLAWTAGLAALVALLHGRMDLSAVHYSARTQQFTLPGSWWPLVLMMTIFGLKFAVGITLALEPGLRQSTAFALLASTAYGALSGVFLSRAMALLAFARRVSLQAA